MRPERWRQFVILVTVLIACSLAASAIISLLRWQSGRTASVPFHRIAISQAPGAVQEAARALRHSRVGYAMPLGAATYVIVSAGDDGPALELKDVRSPYIDGPLDVHLTAGRSTERLVLAVVEARPARPADIHYLVDGREGVLPALLNPDAVPLVSLPKEGELVVTGPQAQARVAGGTLLVTGFARLGSGQVSVQVFGHGTAAPLGEMLRVRAAAAGRNWASFRAEVPLDRSGGGGDGLVLVYDPDSGTKALIPVHFGSK